MSDEICNELVHWMVVDLFRGSHLGHHTFVHDNDVIADGHGFRLVVGYVDGCNSHLLLDSPDFCPHLDPKFCVQV